MNGIKPVRWVANSREVLREFPAEARREIGIAIFFAQQGDKHPSAKPLKGFGGAGVVEIVEDYAGDSYRAVSTVRLTNAIYVLHAFKKKSTRGAKTPKHEIDLIKQRLQRAEDDHRSRRQSIEEETE